MAEAMDDVGARYRAALLDERAQRRPERDAANACRLLQALQLELVRAQRQTEHVCGHLLADTLALELRHQSQKHLIGDVRQR